MTNRVEPRVSVVIPAYNRADTLRETLDSLVVQTFRNFEVIVVDDGSTDDTARIVQSHAIPTTYARTVHRGPAHARNVGMSIATGDYIAYLDSDDLYYPYKIGMQVKWLDDHPDHVMVYTNFSAFDSTQSFWDELHLQKYHESAYRSKTRRSYAMFPNKIRLNETRTLEVVDPIVKHRWSTHFAYWGDIYSEYRQNTIVFTNSMMFRRSVIERIGMQDVRFGHFHDLEFTMRITAMGHVAFLDLPTYALRYHSGQVTSNEGAKGKRVAIKKQQDLLRVARYHQPPVASTLSRTVDKNLRNTSARLAKAVATLLIAKETDTKLQARTYNRRARTYLNYARSQGTYFRILWIVSYTPSFVRRVFFWVEAHIRIVQKSLLP